MTSKNKATPASIAKNGHIAAIIRRELAHRKWSHSDMARAMGPEVSPTSISQWARAVHSPGIKYIRLLSATLDIPETELLNSSHTKPPANTPAETSPAARSAALRAETISFTADGFGSCRIKLDVTLPIEHGVPLFRVLLDSGLIKQRDENEPANTNPRDAPAALLR